MIRPVLLALTALASTPALVQIGQSSAQNGVVYLTPTDVLVGSPDDAGRPAFLPGFDNKLTHLPDDLSSFTILGGDCDRKGLRNLPSPVTLPAGTRVLGLARGDLDKDGIDEAALLVGPTPAPGELLPYVPLTVEVYEGTTLVGRLPLTVTAFACDIAVQDVTRDGRPDIVVAWRSAGGSGFSQGATVLGLR